jgi:hypothetical protein
VISNQLPDKNAFTDYFPPSFDTRHSLFTENWSLVCYSHAKMRFQSFFMSTTVQPITFASSHLTTVLMALGSFEPAVEVSAAALYALETMEELLKTAKKRENSSLRQLTVAMPSQIAVEAHKRARWYKRNLRKV